MGVARLALALPVRRDRLPNVRLVALSLRISIYQGSDTRKFLLLSPRSFPRMGTYECIDTQIELQSCGGCASKGNGEDCSESNAARSLASKHAY